MDKEMLDFIKGTDKERSPSAPPSKETPRSKKIEDKREELELARLDKELENLKTNAPNKEADYFRQLLEMQEKHFKQLLEINKEQMTLKLEIEQLKLGEPEGDSEMAELEMFMQMLKPKDAITGSQGSYFAPVDVIPQPTQDNSREEAQIEINTKEDLEVYKEKIRKGEISEEQAYQDFLANPHVPKYLKKAPRKTFKVEFEKIKNEKV